MPVLINIQCLWEWDVSEWVSPVKVSSNEKIKTFVSRLFLGVDGQNRSSLSLWLLNEIRPQLLSLSSKRTSHPSDTQMCWWWGCFLCVCTRVHASTPPCGKLKCNKVLIWAGDARTAVQFNYPESSAGWLHSRLLMKSSDSCREKTRLMWYLPHMFHVFIVFKLLSVVFYTFM